MKKVDGWRVEHAAQPDKYVAWLSLDKPEKLPAGYIAVPLYRREK